MSTVITPLAPVPGLRNVLAEALGLLDGLAEQLHAHAHLADDEHGETLRAAAADLTAAWALAQVAARELDDLTEGSMGRCRA